MNLSSIVQLTKLWKERCETACLQAREIFKVIFNSEQYNRTLSFIYMIEHCCSWLQRFNDFCTEYLPLISFSLSVTSIAILALFYRHKVLFSEDTKNFWGFLLFVRHALLLMKVLQQRYKDYVVSHSWLIYSCVYCDVFLYNDINELWLLEVL